MDRRVLEAWDLLIELVPSESDGVDCEDRLRTFVRSYFERGIGEGHAGEYLVEAVWRFVMREYPNVN